MPCLPAAGDHRDPGFGVYVHWPFCAQKCPYCDFNSHVRHAGWDEARYLAAYRRELDSVAERTGRAHAVSSIFFGGGTPSLMQPATVAAILDHVAQLWSIDTDAEITLEANPGSVEAERFRGYRAAGVNRVSLGVQSLDDEQLRRLGRVHTVAEAMTAIEVARRTFDRFSFDLIYARPGQSVAAWRRELAAALAFGSDHLSLYQLTIEPDTPFAALHRSGKLVTPEPEAASDLYDVTQELTEAVGLPAYEISNHARPGQESRHNLLYWRYGAYAGVGPGAHGRLASAGAASRSATSTIRNPEAWLAAVESAGHGFSEEAALSHAEQADEMLLMGLRITAGLDLGAMAALTGRVPSQTTITRLVGDGLLLPPVEGRLAATRRGRLVLDWIVTELATSLVPRMASTMAR
ncbi:MAG: coproporphyrinogen III oxidase [Hyphomicrobiaceae bacterium]|nr:coproporphyrinogen III oxidase [Hyphomicrobiaceae bacterium]